MQDAESRPVTSSGVHASELRQSLSKPDALLLLLLATDGLIIVLHLLHVYSGRFRDSFFALQQNGSFGEAFQYVKFLWLALTLLFVAVRKREWLYLSWSILFGFLFVDDLMEIHERVGRALREPFGFQPMLGLRAVDFGELLASGVAGLVLLSFIGLTYLRADDNARSTACTLVVLLLALAFFGIVVDMTHIIANGLIDSRLMDVAFVVAEDGGEMLVASVMLWFVLRFGCRELALRFD